LRIQPWVYFTVSLVLGLLSLGSAFATGASPVVSCPAPKSDLVKWAEENSWKATGVSNRVSLTDDQEVKIEKFTTVFENGTTKFQYGSISQLNDGKGLNVGRVGFNTRAGTLQKLVNQYLSIHPENLSPAQLGLKKYQKCLNSLKGGDYECLYPGMGKPNHQALLHEAFGEVWQAASKDPLMIKLQDDFVKENYVEPAFNLANKAGLKSALARAFIYDTFIQSGSGGTDRLVAETMKNFKQAPDTPEAETAWLKTFSEYRKRLLARGKVDTSTRVDALENLLNASTVPFDLRVPIHINYHGDFEINSDN
jgi:chitosanase